MSFVDDARTLAETTHAGQTRNDGITPYIGHVELAEYDRVQQSARAEYERVKQSALAEYDRVQQHAFWDLFANPDNRSEAWR